MADVTINYEGNAIATMSASGTKTLLTEGKYCTDDIEVVYVSPGGGGGGLTTIASGTITGSDAYGVTVSIGTKMACTDFMLVVKAKTGEEYAYNTDYKYTTLACLVLSDFGHFDLSTDGANKQIISDLSYGENNSGVVTSRAVGSYAGSLSAIRNGAVSLNVGFNQMRITRDNSGFSLYIGQSNPAYKWPSTIDYEYRVVYFGNNAATDIVEVP